MLDLLALSGCCSRLPRTMNMQPVMRASRWEEMPSRWAARKPGSYLYSSNSW